MTKEQMAEVWRKPGVQQGANLCRWDAHGISWPGELRSPQKPATVVAWRKRVLGGHGWPALNKSYDPNKPVCPDWLRERYRQDCPRNYKALVAAFGQTHTKYDSGA
jgi:hypothetical protein